jgi:hypothetical protein
LIEKQKKQIVLAKEIPNNFLKVLLFEKSSIGNQTETDGNFILFELSEIYSSMTCLSIHAEKTGYKSNNRQEVEDAKLLNFFL